MDLKWHHGRVGGPKKDQKAGKCHHISIPALVYLHHLHFIPPVLPPHSPPTHLRGLHCWQPPNLLHNRPSVPRITAELRQRRISTDRIWNAGTRAGLTVFTLVRKQKQKLSLDKEAGLGFYYRSNRTKSQRGSEEDLEGGDNKSPKQTFLFICHKVYKF